ncbi:PLP-dependent aminotransferase family protein [Actinotalea sp. M2MS4P-6]|uniref:MocR-like transcription factor YczR n=1 Tax=Actinotalea sp. M2MS4P-6 TaxID=2983762 RepID=UPI0021E36076|nr:PLP-dependent aminotransferase family protein [Actinotalea sp. M2MS4P-6]MCV2396435.1 PLP-dependent aminotransferase family protein [Actinotalea sp. M2MS4P-6]
MPDRQITSTALTRLLGPLPPGAPAYQALSDAVHRAVLDGALPLGTRLPSERDLALALGMSRTTTAAAYDRLRSLGVLRTRRGSGSVTTLPADSPRGGALLVPDTGDDGTIDLTIATPPAPSALVDAARRAVEQLPAYAAGGGYAYLGLPELRSALAARYTRRGVPTRPDQILVTTGAQHATQLLLRLFAGIGDRVAVENPGYPHAIAAIRSTGARPVGVPVGANGHDLDMLEATLRQAAPRLVHLTPDHHNPTGTSLDADGRVRLRGLATRFRTPVVGDETLTDLTLDGEPPSPFLGSAPDDNLVAIGSASKSFWGGLRIGWVRAPRDLVLRLGRERVHHDLSTAVLEQLITVELLREEDAVLAERRAGLRARRDALVDALRDAVPWTITSPAGGLSVWADLGAPLSSALAAVAPRHGVRVAPGTAFGVDGSFENRVRLPFAASPERLRLAASRLADAWSVLAPDTAAPVSAAVPI